jgi:hypothetical protein
MEIATKETATALIKNLYVESQGLEGDILGSNIGKLHNLEVLMVYTNNFNGSIASEIGQLNRLDMLAADSNDFTGSLPEQISQLLNRK